MTGVKGNASVYQVNPVSRITGEGRAEFSRTWGSDFDQKRGGRGGAGSLRRCNSSQARRNSHSSQPGRPAANAVEHAAAATATQSALAINMRFGEVNPDFFWFKFYLDIGFVFWVACG